ncbi:TonB-dependent receptor [Arenibacter latericius]|uniref:TonB-dependent receptor n=1 Tax=Arenibacter latericius TaxID=86104 RepID=UPI00041FF13C|nr:TonB-dependent receptor [Arenibacter latericius]MDX1363754.1 TonB-dependent receptor [Arenibacter latericius]
MRTTLLLFFLLFGVFAYSQTSISGTVVDQNNAPVPGTNLVIIGKAIGTVTDFDGKFTLNTSEEPPFTLNVTSIGFVPTTVSITQTNQTVTIVLNEEQTRLDEVVISASRTPERIFESPVTVERFGLKEIKNTASADFYDGLENLKGVDINTNSLTFKSINTRGFASFANTRFMQLVDGMDNSTPALNFPIGNLVGMGETDVQSVELLPGASSALYGANAFNGILFMRSKSPFDYSGISAYAKRGITSQDASGDNAYTDFGIRAALKFSEKFAGKVNFSSLRGVDWAAVDYSGKPGTGATRASLDYDGYNIYGDEVSTNIRAASGGLGIIPDVVVSRTGYEERDLTDYKAESVKADWGLYYRPWGNDFEIAYVGKIGKGATIYQGTNRYNLNNFTQQQHKLEVKNDNFFLRGYVVADKAGDSYDMVFTGININRAWKSDEQWFSDYINTYAGATLTGATDEEAHAAARAKAETGRLIPGTPEFQSTFNKVIKDPDFSKGSQFRDASKYYHADANYNFSHLWDAVDVQVGGSYRKYDLNSFGTIYTDYDGSIKYSEFGIYTQLQKQIDLSEAVILKLTGSARYDKSEYFDGFLSPRISAGFTINRDHNIRASVQTGFRNPTTQDLFIGLDAGRAILVGSAPANLDRYSRTYNVSASGQLLGQPATVTQTGGAAYNNSYLAASVQEFAATENPAVLEIGNSDLVTPEKVSSAEIGYRGKLKNTVVDMSVYYSTYKDFISGENVIAPFYGEVGDNGLSVAAIANGDYKVYQTYTNSDANVNSYGGSIGISTKILGNFDLGGSYTFTQQDFDQEAFPDFRTNFNTPEHKVKANFGNTDLFKNFGFNVAWRWNDTYYWQATFGDGQIPSYHTLDAQINFSVPSIKSTFKAGASNVLGDEYFTAIGTGHIGSMYYVSWTINN